MTIQVAETFLVADRIWVATALLHKEFPLRSDFSKSEIIRKLADEGLSADLERATLSAHLDQHCVANVPPSSGKYRMLFEAGAGGMLRLFRPGDPTHPDRHQKRVPSKTTPSREKLPSKYQPLLDWYRGWTETFDADSSRHPAEEDPLMRLAGSGCHIWADEHADDYVENLRREDQ